MKKFKSDKIIVKDVLDFTKESPDTTPVFVSCYTAKYTEEVSNTLSTFEPVVGLYTEATKLVLGYDFESGEEMALSVGDFKEYSEYLILEMDVEDGYRFADCTEMFLTDKALIIL